MNTFLFEDKELRTFSREIVSSIKKNCKGYLSSINSKQRLYKGMNTNKRLSVDFNLDNADITSGLFFSKLTKIEKVRELPEEVTQSLETILDIHKSTVNLDNYIVTYGDYNKAKENGNVFVIFPLDEMSYIWNDSVDDLYDTIEKTKWYTEPKEESVKDVKNIIRSKVYEKIKEELRPSVEEELKAKWLQYYENQAFEYLNRLPENDPERYGHERTKSLAAQWFKMHQKEFQEHTEKVLIDTINNDDGIKKSITKQVKRLIDFELSENIQKYFNFNSDKFIKEIGKTYNTNRLSTGIRTGNEILISCDRYYAVDVNYYDLYVEERLF